MELILYLNNLLLINIFIFCKYDKKLILNEESSFNRHQKTSVPGDIGNKFQNRGYKIEILRPPLGDELPTKLINYSAIVVFGAPGINDDDDFINLEISWIKKHDSMFHFLEYVLELNF